MEFNTTALTPHHNIGNGGSNKFSSFLNGDTLCGESSASGLERSFIFETVTNSSGALFFAKGNVTFGKAGAINIVASDNGVAFASDDLSYGAVPYLIKGGTGQFKGAIGSAADIFISYGSGNNFRVWVLGVFYVPDPKKLVKRVSSGSSSASSPAQAQCAIKIGPYSVTPFAIQFHSQSVGSENFAYGFGNVLSTDENAKSTIALQTPLSKPILYTSTVASSGNHFNEAGRLQIQDTPTSINFTSVTPGTVVNVGSISMGSIAYHLSNGQGTLNGAFGSMVDVFESSSSIFPIQTFGILITQ